MTLARFWRYLAVGMILITAAAPSYSSDPFPTRPVKVIVPFPPGGGVDILVRALAAELSVKWKQPVIVDNRTGAGGVIGVDAAAKAKPDGYTLLATTSPVITSSRFLYKTLPFNADKDLAPLVLLASADQLLFAWPGLPAQDLKGLVAHARSHPGQMSYGTDGAGSIPHQLYGMLAATEKVELIHVPYRGIAPALISVAAGETQLSSASATVVGPLAKEGKVKLLAATGERRNPRFPEVPTTSEQGYPDLKSKIFYGLYIAVDTPPTITDRIVRDVIEVLERPDFASRQGKERDLEITAGGPDRLAEAIREGVASSAIMIRAANISPE